MNLFINRNRSVVGRCKDETLGRSKAFLAALSTFPLPGMSMCPGAQIICSALINGNFVLPNFCLRPQLVVKHEFWPQFVITDRKNDRAKKCVREDEWESA